MCAPTKSADHNPTRSRAIGLSRLLLHAKQSMYRPLSPDSTEMSRIMIAAALFGLLIASASAVRHDRLLISTSDFGKNVTVPFDMSLRNGSLSLPVNDPRIVRKVEGITPEQVGETVAQSAL